MSIHPKVLIFNRSYWPDAEASGQLLTELCESLREEFDITVIAGRPNHNPAGAKCPFWGRTSHEGVTIRRVPHFNFGKRFLWGRAFNLLSYFVAAAVAGIFSTRPAVIVVETDPFLLPLLGWILRWWHRCPLVVYLQDIYPDVAIALGKVRDSWLTRLLRRSLFYVYRRAQRVVVLGEDMRAVLLKSRVPADRIASVPNWADTTKIIPVGPENQFREQQQLTGRFVVMYSGNMGLCQDLESVLLSAELLQDRSEILFLLVGGGASRARLEQLAAERRITNVRFLDYQPQSELAQSLSAADLHLIPLDHRVTGFLVPSKLYGILAAGVPSVVIADARADVSRVVQSSETGRIVSPGNADALAETIVWFLEHPAEAQAMGCRARALAVAEFDRTISSRRFADVLKNVIPGREVCQETSRVSVAPECAIASRSSLTCDDEPMLDVARQQSECQEIYPS